MMTYAVQECERRGKRVELVRDHLPADLDDGKLGRVNARKQVQVLLHLVAATDVVHELDDRFLQKSWSAAVKPRCGGVPSRRSATAG